VGVTDPGQLARVRELFLATGERALLLRGTDDEPFADPRRRPRIEYLDDGAAQALFDEERGPIDAASTASGSIEAKATADHIRRALEGVAPLPLPIVNELACCLFGAGVTTDLNEAKAIAAVRTHGFATA
jgi:anthranilate phosphoribosyltransferase